LILLLCEAYVLIYLAGPLFSAAEREYNERLTTALETLGYRVFLPQRDGAEAHREPYALMTREERRIAMFNLDRDMVLASDVFLLSSTDGSRTRAPV
jgi:nucleoside 2-deoxyribosyltransferase